MKQAIQLSVMHRELPKEKWLKPEEVRNAALQEKKNVYGAHSLICPLGHEVLDTSHQRGQEGRSRESCLGHCQGRQEMIGVRGDPPDRRRGQCDLLLV